MKVHQLIIGLVLSAILGLEAWTLKSVHDLDVRVAVLTQRLDDQAAGRRAELEAPGMLRVHSGTNSFLIPIFQTNNTKSLWTKYSTASAK